MPPLSVLFEIPLMNLARPVKTVKSHWFVIKIKYDTVCKTLTTLLCKQATKRSQYCFWYHWLPRVDLRQCNKGTYNNVQSLGYLILVKNQNTKKKTKKQKIKCSLHKRQNKKTLFLLLFFFALRKKACLVLKHATDLLCNFGWQGK